MRQIVFLLVLLLGAQVTLGFSVTNSQSFENYIQEFGKEYNESEYEFRKAIFLARVREVESFNSEGHSYYKGINHMSDWTDEELSRLNAAKVNFAKTTLGSYYIRSNRTLPFEVDYRTRYPPILTAVKNQGRCGSCWAHSAVEAIESHWALATGKLHVLSQQQLTSCTPNPRHCGGTGGCSGSVESLAFDYVVEAGGIMEEWAYPYTSYSGDDGVCRNVTGQYKAARVTGYVSITQNDQEALMDALAFQGPIAVSVDASNWSTYQGGIFTGCDYGRNITQNHAVQLVGYGYDRALNMKYWIIRNSWGPMWGENGYMRLLRTDTPRCGWNVETHNGGACDGDPDEEWVCGTCGVLSGATYPLMYHK